MKILIRLALSAFIAVSLAPLVSTVGQHPGPKIESLEPDKTEIRLSCPAGRVARNRKCNDDPTVRIKVSVSGEELNSVKLDHLVTGGRVISSTAEEINWDLSGVQAGRYTATVAAVARSGRLGEPKTLTVTVSECPDCVFGDACPVIALEVPQGLIDPGTSFVVKAKVAGVSPDAFYNWTLSAGNIAAGQGTPEIMVSTDGLSPGSSVTATLEVRVPAGFPMCQNTFSETVALVPQPEAALADEFSTVKTTCEDANARLDAFFIELNNNPNDRGLILIYDSSERRRAAWYREQLLGNFIKLRRYDRSRIAFVRGSLQKDAKVQFWRVPPGASDPKVLEGKIAPSSGEPALTKPYLYATQYVDGLPECEVPMFDLAEYAVVLNTEPRSRGRIVIGRSSRARFAREQRDVAATLAEQGVSKERLTFVYKYVRPNLALETTEIWVIPRNLRSLM